MKYSTVVTSKGTVTIAAPLRKALGIQPGQKLSIGITKDNRLLIDAGTNLQTFQAKRAAIVKKIPSRLKGLSADSLRKAATKAWLAGYND